MKHITMEYGQKTNLLECTFEEWKMIDSFLSKMGVETRHVRSDSQKVVIQARNGYQEWCMIAPNHSGKLIRDIVESDIKSGHWRR